MSIKVTIMNTLVIILFSLIPLCMVVPCVGGEKLRPNACLYTYNKKTLYTEVIKAEVLNNIVEILYGIDLVNNKEHISALRNDIIVDLR